MEFHEYDTRLAAYAVIVDEQDRILLALWNEGSEPAWTMPGGGVELTRPPRRARCASCARRRGTTCGWAALLGVDTHVLPAEERHVPNGRPLRSVRVVFEAEIVGGELTHEVDGTTDEARWVPLADVPTLDRVGLVDAAAGPVAVHAPVTPRLTRLRWVR